MFSNCRWVSKLPLACCLSFALSEAAAEQHRNRGSRERGTRLDRVAGDNQSGVVDIGRATALLDTDIRLGGGQRVGFVDDFVVDNAGRVLFVLADLQGETVAIPLE